MSNPSILKPVKSVSFEDTNDMINDDVGEKVLKNQQNEKDSAGSGTSNTSANKVKQNIQQPQPPVAAPLEMLTKKDKRRGTSYMKQNGFFGADGECSFLN